MTSGFKMTTPSEHKLLEFVTKARWQFPPAAMLLP